ncbi:sel1 repeat family protein, partial [Neisseria sp. P0006.S009]
HFQQQLRLAEQLEGENGIQEQNNAQHWLGRCYFEQAKQAEGGDSEHLFGLAVKHFQQQLRFAKQLEDENGIQKQINAQSWLGSCYYEQAKKAKGENSGRLFESVIKHQKQRLRLAKQLEGENGIQKQINAQSWLGSCYYEQAKKAKGENSERLFESAIKHQKQRLRLAKQLEGENGIQKQINAQSWLGSYYYEQAKKAKGENSERLFESAIKHQK